MTMSDLPSFADMPGTAREIHAWLLSDSRLDVLRDRLTLSEMVGRTVALEQAPHGEMHGPCPAHDHDDDQKAFYVNDRKGFFHCFGCGIHGDAIRWMTDYENVEYVEAMRLLAHRAGLVPPEDAPRA